MEVAERFELVRYRHALEVASISQCLKVTAYEQEIDLDVPLAL